MTKETRHIGSFVVVDGQGNAYPTDVQQEFWTTAQNTTPGLKIGMTSTGEQVMPLGLRNPDGSRECKLVSLTPGKITRVTSNDPNQSCFDP